MTKRSFIASAPGPIVIKLFMFFFLFSLPTAERSHKLDSLSLVKLFQLSLKFLGKARTLEWNTWTNGLAYVIFGPLATKKSFITSAPGPATTSRNSATSPSPASSSWYFLTTWARCHKLSGLVNRIFMVFWLAWKTIILLQIRSQSHKTFYCCNLRIFVIR